MIAGKFTPNFGEEYKVIAVRLVGDSYSIFDDNFPLGFYVNEEDLNGDKILFNGREVEFLCTKDNQIWEKGKGRKLGTLGKRPCPPPFNYNEALLNNKNSILKEAQSIIYNDREQTYGHPSKNLKTIAALWTNYLDANNSLHAHLTIDDVCMMMVLMKVARLANSPTHRDSMVDIAGYTALMARCQEVITGADSSKNG